MENINNTDNNRVKKDKLIFAAVFVIGLVFYLAWYILDGIILTPDAETYINMSGIREGGYCTFLWALRTLFGEWVYLHIAVIIQCVVASIAAVALAGGLKRRFGLSWLLTLAILAVQYGLTLLNRFVAQRHYSYFNSIETEGLTYSLWIFFVLSVIGILYDRDKKSIVSAVIWAFALTSIRKQMLLAFVLLFPVLVYIRWGSKKRAKAVLTALLTVIMGLFLVRLSDCTYNFAVRGVFAPHTDDSSFILGTQIYTADKAMAERLENPVYKELFLEIMERAEEKEYNISFAESGWSSLENHYSESYDRIKFDIINAVIREYQELNGIPEDLQNVWYQEAVSGIMKELLIPCLPNMFKLFCANVAHGMITTILKVHPVLNWAALALYILYCALILALLILKVYEKAKPSALLFAAFVLLAIVGNVFITSVTIYCQMRYMLYNTGLFYQAGLIMAAELADIKNRRKIDEV